MTEQILKSKLNYAQHEGDYELMLLRVQQLKDRYVAQLAGLENVERTVDHIEMNQSRQLMQEQDQNQNSKFQQLSQTKTNAQYCLAVQRITNGFNQHVESLQNNFEGLLSCYSYMEKNFYIALLDLQQSHNHPIEQAKDYARRRIQESIDNFNVKYEDILRKFFHECNYPLKKKNEELSLGDNRQLFISYISLLPKIIRLSKALIKQFSVQKGLEFSFLDQLNELAYFHFIDTNQPTARSDKPEWFFKYIYDILQLNISAVFEVVIEKGLPELLFSEYCLHNIKLRIKENEKDLTEFPETAVIFMESAYIFELEMRELFQTFNISNEFRIYDLILSMLQDASILSEILKWEMQVFEENLVKSIQSHVKTEKDLDKKITMFLTFIDDFLILFENLRKKYRGITSISVINMVDQYYCSKMFKSFCDVSQQYFKLIHYYQEDQKKILFLQNYAVGLETLKKYFIQQNEQPYLNLLQELKETTTRRQRIDLIHSYVKQVQQKGTNPWLIKQLYSYYD